MRRGAPRNCLGRRKRGEICHFQVKSGLILVSRGQEILLPYFDFPKDSDAEKNRGTNAQASWSRFMGANKCRFSHLKPPIRPPMRQNRDMLFSVLAVCRGALLMGKLRFDGRKRCSLAMFSAFRTPRGVLRMNSS